MPQGTNSRFGSINMSFNEQATAWATGESKFDTQREAKILLFAMFRTGSGAHTVSCPMSTGDKTGDRDA
jgi:hypothetical protein